MNWLHYLVEANIYLGVFYLCYCLFLNNETHYTLGRVYLLFSCVLAFVLPLTQLSILKPDEIVIEAPIVPVDAPHYVAPVTQQITIEAPVITLQQVLFYAYLIGVLITMVVFAVRIYRLSLLARKGGSVYADKYKMIRMDGNNTAFSFFNYLFIGNQVPKAETIIAHELVHIRQKHSADIIFIELLKVINWFNPLIYLVQRSLRTVHEYIADEQTAAYEQDALSYSSFLVNNAYGVQGYPIAHSFFNYNLLKKRIIMLNQKRSGNLARLKYLLAVPLCAGMLCASTLVFSKDYAYIDLAPRKAVADKPITVKYLKIVDKQKNIIAYSDNLSFTQNGVQKKYVANTITADDIAYINKTMKLAVEVIEVDSKTKMQVPMVITPNGATDTPKYKHPIPPPPIIVKDGFDDVHTFLFNVIKYPKDALIKEKKGNAIVSFNVDGNGKLGNVKLLHKAGAPFDDLLINALPKFKGTINAKAGTYKMEVIFDVLGGKFISITDEKTRSSADFAGQAQIAGMTDAQRKKYLSPPPPPAEPKKVGVKAPKEIIIDPPVVEPKYVGSTPPPPPPPPKKAVKAKAKADTKAAVIVAPKVSVTPVIKLKPLPQVTIDSVQTTVSTKVKNEIKLKLKEDKMAQVSLKKIDVQPKVNLKLESLKEIKIDKVPDTLRLKKSDN